MVTHGFSISATKCKISQRIVSFDSELSQQLRIIIEVIPKLNSSSSSLLVLAYLSYKNKSSGANSRRKQQENNNKANNTKVNLTWLVYAIHVV